MKLKLDTVVREWLFESGNTEHKYARALSLAISCLRELHMDLSGSALSRYLSKNDNDTVNLPNDFVSLISIGYVDGGNNLHPLYPALNKKVKGFNASDCLPNVDNGENKEISERVLWGQETANHYSFGQNTYGYFGVGGGQNAFGYYTIHEDSGYISLDSYKGGNTIYIEYLSNMKMSDGSFMVHPYIINTVKHYISYRMASSNIRVPLNQKEALRRDYLNERKISVSRFSSFTKEEFLQSIRKGNKLSPKF